jgi:hypothetical protein
MDDTADLLHTHLWSDGNPRPFTQNGKTIILRQCSRCRRDFAQGLDGAGWHGVYVGVFKVELLPKAVNIRWVQSECPKQLLAQDDIDRELSRRNPG